MKLGKWEPTEGPMTKEETERWENQRKAFDELRELEDKLEWNEDTKPETVFYYFFNEYNPRTGEFDKLESHPVVFRDGRMIRVDGKF